MNDSGYLNKIKNDIANKKAMVNGLKGKLRVEKDTRNQKSLKEEIRRGEQEIQNLERQMKHGK